MATVQHSLRIGINGTAAKTGAREVTSALGEIEKKGASALRSIDDASKKTTSSVGLLKKALAGLAVGALAKSLFDVTRSYESLNASLITATGSASGAAVAFEKLKEFAKTTPFTLEGATQAYNRLASAGLTPTIEKLRAFGDIASSISGKTIIDFVEAVADATQGQDKRLKEFGINMTNLGDQMQIAFGKTKVVVENNAQAIEAALVKLAQDRFGGAMALQAKTLGGAFSNLEDSVSLFAFSISQAGLSEALRDLIVYFSELINGSGDLAEDIGSVLGGAVKSLGEGVEFLVKNWHALEVAAKVFISVGAAIYLASLASTIYETAMAFNVLTLSMAKNPIGVLAVAVTAAIAYFIDWSDLLGLTADKTSLVDKETEIMTKRFQAVNPDSLEQVLAVSTDISNEIKNTNEQLVLAGGNMANLAARAVLLKSIEKESLGDLLNLVQKITEEKVTAANAQEMGLDSYQDPADLKAQLAVLKTERANLKKDLIAANNLAGSAQDVLAGKVKYTVQDSVKTQGSTIDTSYTTTAELDPDAVRSEAQKTVELVGKLDANMSKITEIESKLGKKASKVSKKELAAANKAAEKEADRVADAIRGLQADASAAQTQLDLTLQNTDPKELAKLLKYTEEYNKITKNGTVPITQEQTSALRAATDQQIEAEFALKNLNDQREREKDALEEAAKAEKKRAEVKASIGSDFADTIARNQLELSGLTTEEIQKQTMLLDLLNKLKTEGIAYTAEELALWTEQINTIASQQKAIGQQGKKTPIEEMISQFTDLTKVTEQWQQIAVNGVNQFATTLNDALWSGEMDFAEFAKTILKEVTAMLIKLALAAALKAAISGATGGIPALIGGGQIGSYLIGSSFHTGGTVGEGGATRAIATSSLSGAPRLHSGTVPGLASDEYAAILQRGEQVLTQKQATHLRAAMGTSPTGGSAAEGSNAATGAASGGAPRFGRSQRPITFVLPGVSDSRGFQRSTTQEARRMNRMLVKKGEE